MAAADVTQWFTDLAKIQALMKADGVGPSDNLHDFSLQSPNGFVQNNPNVAADVNNLIAQQIGTPVATPWKQATMRLLLDAARKPVSEEYADLIYDIALTHCQALPPDIGGPHLKDVLNALCADPAFLPDVQAQVNACTEATFTGAAGAFADGTLTMTAAIEKVLA